MKKSLSLAILIFSAFNFQFSPPWADPPKAEAFSSEVASLGRAERLFLEEKYERVVAETDKLIESRSDREEAYYLKGLSLIKLKRFQEARSNFQKVISRYQMSRRAFDSYLGIGDSYFLEGNIQTAIQTYEDILNRYPKDKNLSLVYYRLGNSYGAIGSNAKAKEYYDMVRHSSPLSFEAKAIPKLGDAAANNTRVIEPAKADNNFSVQVGYFKNRSNAGQLADKLLKKKYDSYVESYTYSGTTFYRVKVGRLASSEDAKRMASKLRTLGYSTKICTNDFCR